MPREPKLNLKDHDLLIRLDQKVDNLIISMDKLNDGTTQQLAQHDLRINALEKLHEELNPKEIATQVKDNTDFIKSFKITWRLMIFTTSIISAVISFILALVTIALRIFQFNSPLK